MKTLNFSLMFDKYTNLIHKLRLVYVFQTERGQVF